MRTLRRPMFRGGSTGTGITSGLAPKRGRVDGPGGYAGDPLDTRLSEFYGGDPTLKDIMEVSRAARSQPRGANMGDFLIDFGLDYASRTPAGSIFATAAASAKEPYQRLLKRQSAADVQGARSEADMFKMLMEGAIGKDTYAHRDKAAMIRENMDKQYTIIDQINALNTDAADYLEQKKTLTRALRKLKEQVSGDDFAKAQLKYWSEDQNSRKLDRLIRLEVGKLLNMDPDTTFEESKKFAEAFIRRRNEVMNEIRLGMSPTFNFATGGRVGYQAAGPVMGQPTQADAMPEELSGISYEDLRARLPQEVSDEIVKLLANSAEALEDFATIQTEQDIANFNKKYGVNLVLPAEG